MGGKDVLQDAVFLEEKSASSSVHNYVGKLNLVQSAAVIKQCRLFVGTDSGLMHLACAVGIPVIALFGPSNTQKWGPKGIIDRIISEYVACLPCTKFGYTVPTCRGSYHCMRDIQVPLLCSAVERQLLRKGKETS